jgi:hypothetical protein
VLVHIERKDRLPASKGRRMVHGPLIDELPVARRPAQQHPARAAAQRLSDRREFGPPVLYAFEVARQRFTEDALGFATRAERRKEKFMQNHRIGRISFSRLRPLMTKMGAVAKSSSLSRAVIALRRWTVPNFANHDGDSASRHRANTNFAIAAGASSGMAKQELALISHST